MVVTSSGTQPGTLTGTAAGLRTVVVATDFSRDGEQAVWRATHLPLSREATLLITHVLPAQRDHSGDSLHRSAAERQLDLVALRIREHLVAAGRSDVCLKLRVARGVPAEEIARSAGTNQADLVLVGRRGHNPLRELLIGSTASNLLRHSRFPVLVATESTPAAYREAVLGFDFSPAALAATRLVMSFLPPMATIHVVHAEDVVGLRTPEELAEVLETYRAGQQLRVAVRLADPRLLLLEVAGRVGADLIVMGSRGLSGLARVALGSVAESVLQRARVDVLIVPGRAA